MLGAPKLYRGKLYRVWTVEHHRIVYRTSKDALMVIAILHHSMDAPRHLP